MKTRKTEDGVFYLDGNTLIKITSDMLDNNTLTDREKETVRVRLGFDGKGMKNMAEASKILGCSRERVRALEDNAFFKLSSKYPLSIRAINVLQKGHFLVGGILIEDRFLNATPEKIKEIRGCGAKTYKEIIEYRNTLTKK